MVEVLRKEKKNTSMQLSIRKAEGKTILSELFSKRETLRKSTQHFGPRAYESSVAWAQKGNERDPRE